MPWSSLRTEAWPLPEHEWKLYALDQQINDRGVRVDKKLVKKAIAVDEVFTEAAYQQAKELTGLENPGSVNQLKAWLADQDMPMESLAKKIVQETKGSCPLCGKKIILKKSKKGRSFYGCDNYPNCNFMTWNAPVEDKCPKCGSSLFKKGGKAGKLLCEKPDCGYERNL